MCKKIIFGVICCIYYVTQFGAATVTSIATDIYDKFHQNDYKLKFERNYISYVNKSLGEANLVTYFYNRTMKANNFTFVIYDDYDQNDLKVEIQVYKFLSNEYRRFPIHFQMDLCRSLEENIGGTSGTFHCGNVTSCPFKKNTKYFTCNNMIDETRFPPLIPSGQYKVEIRVFAKTNVLIISNMHVLVYRTLKPGQSGRD